MQVTKDKIEEEIPKQNDRWIQTMCATAYLAILHFTSEANQLIQKGSAKLRCSYN